jgi:hypothetical protein
MTTLIIAATVTSINQYFINLFNNGIAPALYGIGGFFFGWGCIGLMFPGQRGQEQAKENLYRVLGGLTLALLTAVIVSIFQTATGGPPTLIPPGTPTPTP